MKNQFEINGYSIDYYLRGKYVGSIKLNSPDRDVMGYMGRMAHIADSDIYIKNRKYKKGTQFVTECVTLCGKFIGTKKEKINAMLNSRVGYGEL